MASPARRYVTVEDLARIIFEKLGFVWLQLMWNEYEDDQDELIEVLYLLYLTHRQTDTLGAAYCQRWLRHLNFSFNFIMTFWETSRIGHGPYYLLRVSLLFTLQDYTSLRDRGYETMCQERPHCRRVIWQLHKIYLIV